MPLSSVGTPVALRLPERVAKPCTTQLSKHWQCKVKHAEWSKHLQKLAYICCKSAVVCNGCVDCLLHSLHLTAVKLLPGIDAARLPVALLRLLPCTVSALLARNIATLLPKYCCCTATPCYSLQYCLTLTCCVGVLLGPGCNVVSIAARLQAQEMTTTHVPGNLPQSMMPDMHNLLKHRKSYV